MDLVKCLTIQMCLNNINCNYTVLVTLGTNNIVENSPHNVVRKISRFVDNFNHSNMWLTALLVRYDDPFVARKSKQTICSKRVVLHTHIIYEYTYTTTPNQIHKRQSLATNNSLHFTQMGRDRMVKLLCEALICSF